MSYSMNFMLAFISDSYVSMTAGVLERLLNTQGFEPNFY